MQKLTFIVAAATLSAVLSSAVAAQNIAVVNNRPIKKSLQDEWVKQLTQQGQTDSPELRQKVKEELIRREVLMQEASRRGLAKKPDIQLQIENQRQAVLIQALMRDELEKNPIKDEEIASEYEKQKKEAPQKEFKASHILVKTEEEAQKVLTELKKDKGKNFAALAKKHSTDTGSAKDGGALDWAAPEAYVKPFSDALVKLEKGKMTEEPVQTRFGYHLIRLDDVRDTQFPPLDQVKQQLTEMMHQQKIQRFVEGLQSKAKIK